MDQIYKTKEALDIINYGETVPYSENVKEDGKLNSYKFSEQVEKDIDKIKKCIKNNNQLHIGVISAGTHTLDYQKVFDFKPDENWSKEPVMFVYECPANNMKSSFYGKNDIKEISEKDVSEDLLCNCLWHLNPEVNIQEDFKFFGNKKYSEFILSVIKTFKLANFYTTNFFRYEIYEVNNKNNETALNFGKIQDIMENDNMLTESFKAEINAFRPKVIFATSNPYNWLKNNWDKSEYAGDMPLIIKVPHPANRDSNTDRFLKNAFAIKAGLDMAGIKNSIQSEKIFDVYKELLKADSLK